MWNYLVFMICVVRANMEVSVAYTRLYGTHTQHDTWTNDDMKITYAFTSVYSFTFRDLHDPGPDVTVTSHNKHFVGCTEMRRGMVCAQMVS